MSDAQAVIRPAHAADCEQLCALLETAKLPLEGVAEWLPHFVVAEAGDRIVGVAGLEVYGTDGLLRSVAVTDDWRGRGLGVALTDAVLADSARLGLRSIYLLTETADGFFPRFGFRRIERAEASAAVQQSAEFRELCPASSTVMILKAAAS